MSSTSSPANSALVAELSFSFQDELTATIHNAFGVAVEMAVLEITKLVGQALGDVRDQMHETLRENKSLKQRLQAAEVEVCALRARVNDERNAQLAAACKFSSDGVQQVHLPPLPHVDNLQSQPVTVKQKRQGNVESKQSVDSLLNAEERYGFLAPAEEVDGLREKSFCEIREDGRVCSHDLNSNLVSESKPKEPQKLSGAEGNHHGLFTVSQTCVGGVQFDHVQSQTTSGGDTAQTFIEQQSLPDAVCPKSEVEQSLEVKKESPHLACASGPSSFAGAEEDLGTDSLSLAQSRLLEDWRPEPLQLQSCDTDSLVPCTSHTLTDSSVFNPEIPDVLSPAASGMPLPFPKPYHPGEPAGMPVTGQSFSEQMSCGNAKMAAASGRSQHVCKVCGQAFQLAAELRKHRVQHHGHAPAAAAIAATGPRHPKRQVFPPGRSPYHCSLCRRDFNRMEHLKIHQRIHTGERPYACSVCNARFRHSWALTRHFRIHTGEKPYACGQCGKTFRNCGGLRFHQRSHSIGGVP
ncbi:hypothetical protein GJAV_G00125940 [Gymnothorax javanicus]|nr:hypothetical protein GJAV_G00125940 [Gymnothorax javanicus]